MLMRSVVLAVFACFAGAALLADLVYKVGHVAADDVLNVRQGPSVDFDILMGLPPGYRGVQKLVCVLVKPDPHGAAPSQMPEWCMIADHGGMLGWVNARYLVVDTAPPARLRLVAGYRSYDDACQLVGESEAVADYLDHSADLVACPKEHPGIVELQQEMGAQPVTELDGYVLLSIPRG
ncbi:SH3 domain-containing protein [Primorskyibacter aestuariivivens]|uniref:SH3 domain-containing protein n=1 Tax=Primorskyibacter aestuariivivens TaxID=1888912 RepID=UPI002301C88B|nr:SH3 domain-containing protein [Primorskyibacter aestuariivivens]MDA7428577.1 SH3 domain-containing protein [Primorskyibacter aestuariivivens]